VAERCERPEPTGPACGQLDSFYQSVRIGDLRQGLEVVLCQRLSLLAIACATAVFGIVGRGGPPAATPKPSSSTHFRHPGKRVQQSHN